jgi:HAD superfamily hydrolase (TIGR01549 family)
LVWPNWTRIAEALARQGISADPASLAAADPHARYALDVAEIVNTSTDLRRAVEYFNLVLTHASVPLSDRTDRALAEVREYQRVTNLWEHVPEFVCPTLKALRGQGLRLGVVSNANGTLRVAFERIGLASFFDVILDSAEEGLEKPDPRLFELALQRLGVTSDRAIHVGDMYYVDVVGARSAGLAAVLVDEAGLRANVDCKRIRSIAELPAMLRRRTATQQ